MTSRHCILALAFGLLPMPGSAQDKWSATSMVFAPAARDLHSGVWTGSRLIVWGGYRSVFPPGTPVQLNDGASYDPVADAWVPTGSTGVPSARENHVAVWAGSRMIVWGGSMPGGNEPTGGIYAPASNTWVATSTLAAPAGRARAAAVWTGSKMIVWGGYTSSGPTPVGTGGVYDPTTDTWVAVASSGAPSARYGHSAVWTGSRMLVWGGRDGGGALRSGGAYDPASDTWTPISEVNAPSAPSGHQAFWTGARLVVWGGGSAGGGSYDPASDSWATMATAGAPSGALASVWTGSLLIVWGGASGGGTYHPVTDSWTPMSMVGAPQPRGNAATAWTGSRLVLWGGIASPTVELATGGRYAPPVWVSVGDVALVEGDYGTRLARVPVSLSAPTTSQPATVDWATQDASATAGADYWGAAGVLTFLPGQASALVDVVVFDDLVPEPAESFAVTLGGTTGGASIERGQATVTIRDDDPAAADFDGDGFADPTLYRSGAWLSFDYANGDLTRAIWTGQPVPGCIPAPLDVDGDGSVEKTQLCGDTWHFYAPDGSHVKSTFTGGNGSDLPAPGDYDGDGWDEVVVYRLGAWLWFDHATGAYTHGVWTGDPPHQAGGSSIPVPMDYDGDGRTDLTLWSGGPWHFFDHAGAYVQGIWAGSVAGDRPVPGDYDGDGIDDSVVWRDGAWLWLDHATGTLDPARSVWTGAPSAPGGQPLPAPLDTDGDGRLDLAVWSGGAWHFFEGDGTYDRGLWCGEGGMPISRRQLP